MTDTQAALDKVAPTLTKVGATRLAGKIREYWIKQGKNPLVEVIEMTVGAQSIWVVRSDMVGGLSR